MAYYVLFGINGTIIQENYYKTVKCQEYIKKSTMKKFSTFEEAEQAALDHLAEIVPYYIPIPEHIEVNEMVTRAKLDRARKGG